MKKMRMTQLAITMCLIAAATTSYGEFGGSNKLNIDLTNSEDATNKATWSEPNRIAVSPDGLGWDGDSSAYRDGWVKTRPIAVGLSCRSLSIITVNVTIQPPQREITYSTGHKITPYSGDVYIRYSPDLANWSSWQVLQNSLLQNNDKKKTAERNFKGIIRVPYYERDEYLKEIQGNNNEEITVCEIIKQKPYFFSKCLPLIGYVEFLYECGFYGNQRLKSFDAQILWQVSGKNLPANYDSKPWSFKAEKKKTEHMEVTR